MRPAQLKWALALVATALLLNAGAFIWSSARTPKLAYVRSQELVYGYLGMQEARNAFQKEQDATKANLDTLQADIRRALAALPVSGTPDPARQADLEKRKQEYVRYQEVMSNKLHEEEQRMLNGVLGQVNAFVERYAKEQGYDVVLGTTDAGSLLYGNGAMDITDELLAALNADHANGPHQ